MVSTRDPLNAFLDYPDTPVLNAANGSLAGCSLAVKDIFDVAGYPTGRGNPEWTRQAPIAAQTASVVQTLLDAGAHFIGKTQTEEFAYSMIGVNAHYPVPVNPRAPDRVTGGSSSGSAAAVAGATADIALGSDTNSSIRAPACFCGLIGLRTTTGRIPLDHTMPLSPSFDAVGWFARDAALYEAIGAILLGDDAATTRPRRLFRSEPLEDMLLGAAERAAYDAMAATVEDRLGLEAADLPLALDVDAVFAAFRPIQGYEAWQAHGAFIEANAIALDPLIARRFDYAKSITGEAFADARAGQAAWRAAFEAALVPGDLLMLPTTPGAAPPKAWDTDALNAYALRSLALTSLAGLIGWPQITIPLGAVDGAPFGISLMGQPGSDRQLIALARQVMQE